MHSLRYHVIPLGQNENKYVLIISLSKKIKVSKHMLAGRGKNIDTY